MSEPKNKIEDLDPSINFLDIKREDYMFGIGNESALFFAKNKKWEEKMTQIRSSLWKTALVRIPFWIFCVVIILLCFQLIIPNIQFNWLFIFIVGIILSFVSAVSIAIKMANYELKKLEYKYKELIEHMIEKGWLKTTPKLSKYE